MRMSAQAKQSSCFVDDEIHSFKPFTSRRNHFTAVKTKRKFKMAEQEAVKKINKYFQWTSEHDVIMCREVLVSEPFNLKPRSPERGKVWEKIASQLNAIEQPKFRVSSRAVRDRYSLLTTKQAQKLREEEKASGIEVEQSELDILLEEILEREKEGKARIESQDLEKGKKADKEKVAADDVRKQAMERMGDTKKRKSDESEPGKKKVRRSTSDAIDYLKEKSSNDYDLKKEELELRKKEVEVAVNKQDQAFQQQQDMMKALMSQMQQQQQQQQNLQAMFISQQQQQNNVLMALIENKKQG